MINQTEFNLRRQQLIQRLGEGNIAVIASAPQRTRNRDVDYPFRQDSDFFYLTGFNEPNAVAVFIPARAEGEYILFCHPYDATKAIWEGAHAGLDGAVADYKADQAFAIDDLDAQLPGLLENKTKVFYRIGHDLTFDQRVLGWLNVVRSKSRTGVTAPSELITLDIILHEMRLIKSAAEIAVMRRAAQISAEGHIKAMQRCKAGLYEYQLEAELAYYFAQQGLRSVAYPSIVAGGKNACTLHYTENKDLLHNGDLLLIDAGAECEHYAADITRTFPVSGQFSDAQHQLYQLVLDAQTAAIAEIKPNTPWNLAHDAAVKTLTEGLVTLGLLNGNVEELIEQEHYKAFYMHRTGHWLGMDVHDVGAYKINQEWRLLEAGMVLTVEPGLYIPADCTSVAEQWRGIGIRIEDDVLVTADGCEVLTHAVPKTIAAIEALMQAN